MAKKPKAPAKAAPVPEASADAAFDLKQHKARTSKAWTGKAVFQSLYEGAYEFAVPYRRPAARRGQAAANLDRLFDNTAIVSTFRFAGQLQNDMFPPGQVFFKLALGPYAEVMMKEADKVSMARELELVSATVQAFFLSSEWDNAVHEMCVDLGIGTGALLPLEGDDKRPVRFVCVPVDEIATEPGPYGDHAGIFWKTQMTLRQIHTAFPKGVFDARFLERLKNAADDEIDINQDFVREPDGRWRFVAHVETSEAPIVENFTRTQPMAVARYFRVPGEAYGRGPVLLALPTIRTLNKAMELQLKSAAIQMLGLWGYRPGGAFNPDTARIAPGAFWAMQSTGGVLGPDVVRLDPAAGRIDVGNLMSQELRTQVQAALHDTQLGPEQGTPKSATEIMARMRRISENYMGAFGRLVHEIVPVVVRRVIEIAYDKGLIETDVKIDDLLVRIDVLSPIATALKASALSTVIDFMQLVMTVRGQQAIDLLVKTDEALTEIGLASGVPAKFLLTAEERAALEAKLQQAAAAMMAAQTPQSPPAGEGDPTVPAAA